MDSSIMGNSWLGFSGYDACDNMKDLSYILKSFTVAQIYFLFTDMIKILAIKRISHVSSRVVLYQQFSPK